MKFIALIFLISLANCHRLKFTRQQNKLTLKSVKIFNKLYKGKHNNVKSGFVIKAGDSKLSILENNFENLIDADKRTNLVVINEDKDKVLFEVTKGTMESPQEITLYVGKAFVIKKVANCYSKSTFELMFITKNISYFLISLDCTGKSCTNLEKLFRMHRLQNISKHDKKKYLIKHSHLAEKYEDLVNQDIINSFKKNEYDKMIKALRETELLPYSIKKEVLDLFSQEEVYSIVNKTEKIMNKLQLPKDGINKEIAELEKFKNKQVFYFEGVFAEARKSTENQEKVDLVIKEWMKLKESAIRKKLTSFTKIFAIYKDKIESINKEKENIKIIIRNRIIIQLKKKKKLFGKQTNYEKYAQEFKALFGRK